MVIFEASFEGISYNDETFDEEYFIENAKDYVKELTTQA